MGKETQEIGSSGGSPSPQRLGSELDGIQKQAYEGLIALAERVASGNFGVGDEFDDSGLLAEMDDLFFEL